jgi:tetratricopeptide (TPR) repeat protein
MKIRPVYEKGARMSHTAQELMENARRARREHRLDDAKRDLVVAVSLFRQGGVRRDLVGALKALGQIERDEGHGDVARPFYEEAVAICRQEGDPLLLAHTIRHLGDIHRSMERLIEAEPCYHEALLLYRSQQANHMDLANAIRPFALLMDATGRADEATPLWEEARDLYAAVDVRAGVNECSARLARQNPSSTA